MISCYSSAPDGVLIYWEFCPGPASQPHTETGQHSFLPQADSTRLTPAVLLNSAPIWAEDVQWKLNLRHLGPERANHCTDSLCIQILNHSLRTREGGSEEELTKKEELFLTAFIQKQSYWALSKCDISLKCQEGQKSPSYLPSNSPTHKGRSSEQSLQLTR